MHADPAVDRTAAIEVHDLSRSFGACRALDGLQLCVPAGEFLAVFGPNGAGKTTLVKLLARLVRPTQGHIRIFGTDLYGGTGDAALARIGLVGHSSFLYSGLTSLENLCFYARMHRVADPERRSLDLLTEMGMIDRANDLAGTLSRGLRQRLSIARALVHNPDLLLLDEPYTGLDPRASELLSDRLRTIHAQGHTVLMTRHDLALARSLATRFLVLHRGRTAIDERPERVTEGELARLYRERVGGP